MSLYKASGLDGFSVVFYQKNCNVVGQDLFAFISKCFSIGSLPRLCNKTLIVLILKTPSLTKLNNYRSTSLCNVSYKLVTKVIVNRLKDILSSLISPTQSSFVPKRQITDNVVIVKEILHSISQKRSGRGL